jgi:GWxTD domain-containing protein
MNRNHLYGACVVVAALLSSAAAQTPRRPKPPRFVIHEDFRPWWLLDDVRWIILPTEKAAYLRLTNDEQRSNFVDQFWSRRDPTPDTLDNEYENEVYRRIAYANEHFSDKLPGRMTTRGKIFIQFGKPDRIEASAEWSSWRETWWYRYVENVGQNVEFQFEHRDGVWKLVKDPTSGKNAWEMMLSDAVPGDPCAPMKAASRDAPPQDFEPCGTPVTSPPPRFKELVELLSAHVEGADIPFMISTNSTELTNRTDAVTLTITIPSSKVAWREAGGKHKSEVRVYARFTNLAGHIACVVEDSFSESASDIDFPARSIATREYSKTVQLPPGRYRAEVAVQDVNAGKIGATSRVISATEFPTDEFLNALRDPQ